MKVYILPILLLTFGISNQAFSISCADTILDPGDDTRITYHTNSYKFFKFSCKKQSGTRHQSLNYKEGHSCASPRIDGCSIPKEVRWSFTKRDQNLMKPSCNQHDLCYSTKGTKKATCDSDFALNLTQSSAEFGGSYTTSVVVAAVIVAGSNAYKNGQKWGADNNCH